jgi:hypothetical protein
MSHPILSTLTFNRVLLIPDGTMDMQLQVLRITLLLRQLRYFTLRRERTVWRSPRQIKHGALRLQVLPADGPMHGPGLRVLPELAQL